MALEKLKGKYVPRAAVRGWVREADRMIREYGWEDWDVHPHGYPVKVTEIVNDLRGYEKCTQGSKDYLVALANGLTGIMNAWEEHRKNSVWVRLSSGEKKEVYDRELADLLVGAGLCEIVEEGGEI